MKNQKSEIKRQVCSRRFTKHDGQAILLVILVIGGAMLGATTIAGFLINIQLQQAGDVANSAKAVFAAEAGFNCALYDNTHPTSIPPVDSKCFNIPIVDYVGRINLVNGAYAEVVCSTDDTFAASSLVLCKNENAKFILSKGTSGTTKRSFQYAIP